MSLFEETIIPDEFKKMAEMIRARDYPPIDSVPTEFLLEGEAVFRPVFRKALMAGMDIKAKTVLTPQMLYAMRPQKFASGLPSEEYEKVLGKRVIRDLKKYDPITWEVLES